MLFPSLHTGDLLLDRAFRIAIGDLVSNIVPYSSGILESREPCIMAGLDYASPWTRDAALNTWYAAGLVTPDAARNTLLSVLDRLDGGLQIAGQYWDAIIWVTGAWYFYLYTGDKPFLRLAFEASRNSLEHFERDELDPRDGLFRGGACFQDGVAGYPDGFTNPDFSSSILDWVNHNPEGVARPGYGLPMKALSTNCLYYQAYRLLSRMAVELGEPTQPQWEVKAQQLAGAIQRRFWNPEAGSYRYLVDAGDETQRQEGFGHAFALLFDLATPDQAQAVLNNQWITPQGIPCVWPQFERYARPDGQSFGRHCGAVWPQVNAAWAAGAVHHGRFDRAFFELRKLAEKACRDAHFSEVYHPLTGERYGGLQEEAAQKGIVSWKSCERQTWCATGYLFMVLSVLFGMRFHPEGIELAPRLPPGSERMTLSGLRYRDAVLTIEVRKEGAEDLSSRAARKNLPFIMAGLKGETHLALQAPSMDLG